MSSGGNIVGGLIGGIAGFFVGSPFLGAQIGMTIGGLLDPPKGPKVEGPRLSDLSVQTSTYGAVIPRVYGTVPVVGNIFWLENNALKETVTKTKSGGKGGGSKTTTRSYSYSATFAVGLCKGPIAGVRRIWIGADLIYDAGSSDPDTIAASNDSASGFHVYQGTDTQAPNARMQATLGVPNTPAWRGLAYIVFYDLDLKRYGNSLAGAQVKTEVVSSGSYSGPPVVMSTFALTESAQTYGSTALNIGSDGSLSIFWTSNWSVSTQPTLYITSDYDGPEVVNYSAVNTSSMHMDGWSDVPCWATIVGSSVVARDENGSVITNCAIAGFSGNPERCNYHQRGAEKYMVWETNTGPNTCSLFDVKSSTSSTVMATVDGTGYGGLHDIFIGTLHNYAIHNPPSVNFVCYDKTWTALWSINMAGQLNISHAIGGGSACIREENDGQCIVQCGLNFWRVNSSGYAYIGYCAAGLIPINEHGGKHLVGGLWITFSASDRKIEVIDLEHLSPVDTSLGAIVSAESLQSGLLTSVDIDVTALTSTVRGYRIGSVGAIRSALEPLQAAWPFDVSQRGYKIVFTPRGGSSVATILATDLDARSAADQPGVQITLSRETDSQLPRRVTIKHLDYDREYDVGSQYDERLNTSAINTRDIDLPIVLTATEAAGKAQVLLYLYWMERADLAFSLPPTYGALEPADVIALPTPEGTVSVRLTAINYSSSGRLECKGKLANPATYTPTAIGSPGQAVGVTTIVPVGGAKYVLLDIPLLNDSQAGASVICAMCGLLAGWRGGLLMQSTDGGSNWSSLHDFGPPGAAIGTASNTLGVVDSRVIDKASRLAIRLTQGALYDCTELAMLGGANHFAYGIAGRWEIIAAEKCTLQGDGSYILGDLLRGRFGTEWAMGVHAVGDTIVLLDTDNVAVITLNSSSIGQSRLYRGITSGRDISTDSNLAFTYSGVNLKPLSPVYLNGIRDPSTQDWTLSWIRRTRTGGEWRDYVDADLGERKEQYQIDIFADGTYAAVKRTATVDGSPSFSYSATDQTTDFGSAQSTLYLKIYQVSSLVGRGYPLTSSITR